LFPPVLPARVIACESPGAPSPSRSRDWPVGDLVIPFLQHTGATCTSRVKPRQDVFFGQILGDTEAFVSAPVHASLAGRTGVGTAVTLPNGRRSPAVPLRPADGNGLPDGFILDFLRRDWDSVEPARFDPCEIRDAVRRAGVVGLGGAAFPTHVKLQRNPERRLDTLILNGCECEPYLTADHRLMVEAPEAVVVDLQLAARALGVERAVIAIKDNKPDALEALRTAAAGRPALEVAVCATQYPMGAERQLVWAVLDRTVPSAPVVCLSMSGSWCSTSGRPTASPGRWSGAILSPTAWSP